MTRRLIKKLPQEVTSCGSSMRQGSYEPSRRQRPLIAHGKDDAITPGSRETISSLANDGFVRVVEPILWLHKKLRHDACQTVAELISSFLK